MAQTFLKDPDAVLDYKWDWSSWMATGDTISSYTITVPSGLTKTSDVNDTTSVTAWFSGGTVDTTYSVACKIVTAQGRTDERTIALVVVNR